MMNGLKNKLINGSAFRKNILILFTGSGLAQLIPLIAEPFLARIYTKTEFGILALYISVASLFAIIATMRYELAIVLPKKDRKAINVFGLSMLITLIITAVSFIAILSLNSWICKIYDSNEIGVFLYLIPLSVLFMGISQSFNNWSNRKKRYKQMTTARLFQSGTNSGLSIGLGLLGAGSFGLVFSYISSQLLAIFPNLIPFLKKDRRARKLINKTEIKEVAATYSDFPKINSLHAFMDILQLSGISFIIAYFFSTDSLGVYSRTYRIILVPVSLVGLAVGQVFYQQASEMYARKENVRELMLKIVKPLGLISIFGFGILMIIGPDLFAIALGEEWREAGLYARYLAPMMCFRFVISPISQIPIILGKQKQAFFFGLAANIIALGSIVYAGLVSHNILQGFAMLSVLSIVLYVIMFIWYLKILKK